MQEDLRTAHSLKSCASINKEKAKTSEIIDFGGFLVRVTRFERAISTSQMWRGTSSATPGYSVFAIIPPRERKSKIFLSVVIPVVKAVFRPDLITRQNPANARVSRLSGLRLFASWMELGPHPNQARYHLRYTRIFSFCYYTTARAKIKDFPVCGHSCGQGRISVRFGDSSKSRKRPCRKAFRAPASQGVDGVHSTPKAPALPTAPHPDIRAEGDTLGSSSISRFFQKVKGRFCVLILPFPA